MIAPAAIRQLPPAVADAIAAGEVVERPAAVVKELCENAIDAGAARLEIDIDGGGMTRIRVSDDGAGIPADQLRLAVSRHATSKIGGVEDLEEIRSLGFRGEALASIAAVAELRIVSRTAGSGPGAELLVRGSEVLAEGPVAAAAGTTVEVCDLFAPTPARLRFLRGRRSETAAAVRVAADLALAHPEIAIVCRTDSRLALRSPGGTLDDALRAVFGSVSAELLPVAGDGAIRVDGAISEPRAHRGSRRHLVLVVNRRRVHNRSLAAAVEEAYRGLLPVGRYPLGLIRVEIDPHDVDVNVHPTKREVRFRDDGAVFSAVQRACWAVLQESRLSRAAPLWVSVPGSAQGLELEEAAAPAEDRAVATASTMVALTEGHEARADGAAGQSVEDGLDNNASDSLAALAPLTDVAQAAGGWLLADSPGGLVVVDPHAAHEKVLYAELLAARRLAREQRRGGPTQMLLIDVLVECDPVAVARLEAHEELVAAFGYDIRPFGPGVVRCSAVPAAAAAADPERLVRDVLDSLGGAEADGAREHRVAALTACHAAVKLGAPLGEAERKSLLERLVRTPGGITCPHGRPTVLLLDDPHLRRAFGRPAR